MGFMVLLFIRYNKTFIFAFIILLTVESISKESDSSSTKLNVNFVQSMLPSTRDKEKVFFKTEWINSDSDWKKACQLYERNFIEKLNIKHETMIPKIIHQIWVGGPLPDKYEKFISTWKEKHPNWQYKLWLDKDIDELRLINRKIYDESTNFAQKADIARYEILYRFGGIYVDLDFECLKPFDLLNNILDFYAGIEFCHKLRINNAIIAAAKKHPIILDCIKCLEENFYSVKVNNDLSPKNAYIEHIVEQTGPAYLTKIVKKHWGDPAYKIVIFPNTFFFPFNSREQKNSDTSKYIMPETFAVHHWFMSWVPGHLLDKNF